MHEHTIDININTVGATKGVQGLIGNVDALNAAINNLTSAIAGMQNASKSPVGGGSSLADYAGSYRNLSKEIAKTRSELLQELQVLQASRQAKSQDQVLIDSKIAKVKQLEAQLKTLTTAQRNYNKVMGETGASTKRANSSLAELSNTFNKLGSVLGISAGLYGVFRAFQYGTKVISDFDLAQKKLQSVLGETNKGMQKISESAILVGKNSIFGAKGVTELQIELAKMGFAKQEIIDMQEAIVNLATATQEDLASSAEVVANVIRAFELSAKDSTTVVDIMGKAFNDSALDLANFREAIKYVAPIAKQANFTFEETVALLEQLSNAGIKGSLAGTGLTNILSRLGNENSKLVKTVGHTINNFDELIEAMIQLKKDGADLGDTFELVDRRAAATFTILLEGVNTVEQFKEKLKESAGVMKEQTAVQLDSITNKTKLLRNAFDAFILSLDKGDGALSKFIKNYAGFLTDILAVGTKDKAIYQQMTDLATLFDQLGISVDESFSKTAEKVKQATALSEMAVERSIVSFSLGKKTREQANKLWDEIAKDIQFNSDKLNTLILDEAKKRVDKWIAGFGADFDLGKMLPEQISSLGIELNKTIDKENVQYKIQAEVLNILTKQYDEYLKTKELEVQTEDEKNAIIKREIELLELQKAIALEQIKISEDGISEKIKLAQTAYDFDVKIAKKSITDQKELALTLTLLKKKFTGAIVEIEEQYYNESVKRFAKYEEEVKKSVENRFLYLSKIREKQNDALADSFEKNKFGKEKDIWLEFYSMLGLEGEDAIDSFKESIDLAINSINDLVDSWVDSADRIVDIRNQMVDEAQQALETEIALAEAGFASNVSIKRRELEESKRLRKEAIEDQKRAQKIQLALESSLQVASLATTAADLFKDGVKKAGIPGLAFGLAATIALIGMFAKFKALAKEQAVEYGEGGWIGGKSHKNGGTPIVAEKDEFVVRKRSALKYGRLIEAINNDDQISINRHYFNSMKGGVLSTRVSLDDSEDLKAIRKILEKNGRNVSYENGYRIERNGNTITRTKISLN